MCSHLVVPGIAVLVAFVAASEPARAAQSELPTIELVVNRGHPLRIALEERVQLKHVGQPVTGVVTEPVYAYDRIVIAVGTRVRGHIARIEGGSAFVRARAYLSGNLSPPKHAVVRFDALLFEDGSEMPIETDLASGIPHVTRSVAAARPPVAETEPGPDRSEHPTVASRVRSEVRRRISDAVSEAKQRVREAWVSIKSVKEPGQVSRLKDAAVQQLPYHPQYLTKGTIYDAELESPLTFGRVVPAFAAPVGTAPAPDSILTARLATTLDSSKTPRGTLFEAVITDTVFSTDHQVIFPEGTTLTGEVTLARPARRFHRNGQLRFLFEHVQVPNQPAAPLLGALHAIDAGASDRVALDEEGGATLENPKTRFLAPAVSLLSLHASLEGDGHHFADPDGDGSIRTAGSGAGSRGVGGFLGIGVIGIAVSQVTRPVGLALGAYGAARTLYTNVLGKGREVRFPANSPIQVRLAPGPSAP